MVRTSFAVAELDRDEHEYDNWATALTQASTRLDALQTAVTELCRLCEQAEDVHSEQVFQVLEKHGAISKAARARYHAA
jgi:hypothetical protein